MILRRRTYRLVLLFIALVLSTTTVHATTVGATDAKRVCDVMPTDDADGAWSDVIEQMRTIAPLAPSIAHAAQSVAPVARTTRTTRTAETLLRMVAATKAIDSTTASSRYGMYNHKILFVSLSRLHFLNRLMRLRI